MNSIICKPTKTEMNEKLHTLKSMHFGPTVSCVDCTEHRSVVCPEHAFMPS